MSEKENQAGMLVAETYKTIVGSGILPQTNPLCQNLFSLALNYTKGDAMRRELNEFNKNRRKATTIAAAPAPVIEQGEVLPEIPGQEQQPVPPVTEGGVGELGPENPATENPPQAPVSPVAPNGAIVTEITPDELKAIKTAPIKAIIEMFNEQQIKSGLKQLGVKFNADWNAKQCASALKQAVIAAK